MEQLAMIAALAVVMGVSLGRNRRLAWRGLIGAAALTAVPAQAATVYTQGPVNNDGGVRSIFWNADDFTLSGATTLTGATVYLVQDTRQPSNYYNPTISYGLYADLNGTPGTLLQTGSATATRTDAGLGAYAGISYLHFFSWAFDFATPLSALANTRYWLGVQQSDDIALAVLQNGANPSASAQIGGSVTGPYGPRGVGLAFTVQGMGAVTPTVPEPATWGMMILGFGLVGGVARRRRGVVALA